MTLNLKSTLLLPLVIIALAFTSSAFARSSHKYSNSNFAEVKGSHHQGKKISSNTRMHNQHRDASRNKKTHHKTTNNRHQRSNRHQQSNRQKHNHYRNRYHNRYTSPARSRHWKRGHNRHWKRGHRLHRNKAYYPLPYYANYDLSPPPFGHHYVRVDNDILLIGITTGIVIDILSNHY